MSLWRDSQTIQAYLGGQIPITKLPSPHSWATRTAVSCALTTDPINNSAGLSVTPFRRKKSIPTSPEQYYHPLDCEYQKSAAPCDPSISPQEHHYEEIMELKRQLHQTNQDLHLTKVTKSNIGIIL